MVQLHGRYIMIYHDRSIVHGVKLSQTTSLGGHHLEKTLPTWPQSPQESSRPPSPVTSLKSHAMDSGMDTLR